MARWSGTDGTSAHAGLAAIGNAGALGHLERALTEGDPDLRIDSIQALVVTGDARAVPALQAAASRDPDPHVRAAAAEALRVLGESA
jgi:HEAT repeat protein